MIRNLMDAEWRLSADGALVAFSLFYTRKKVVVTRW
jgi:hypothetical protein